VQASDERRSTPDLLGQGLTLFAGPDWKHMGGDLDPLYGSAPITGQRLSAITPRALGIGSAGSLLVRPDGVPATVTTAAALAAA
jgi:hypothetical protein